ncbi:MAG TPA: hypothetical protein VJL89_07410 [Thermodesulfovibrionia bacterium]|nr:hypothetical protein [Thermodesulfovibrionia bacterium]
MKDISEYNIIFKEVNFIVDKSNGREFELLEQDVIDEYDEIKNLRTIITEINETSYLYFTTT